MQPFPLGNGLRIHSQLLREKGLFLLKIARIVPKIYERTFGFYWRKFASGNCWTIYTWIYNHTPCEKRELLTKGLRRKKKRRGLKRKGQGRKGAIIGGTSIHKRPKEIEKRLVPGHWEGDFIIGKDHQSAILTLVERMTRYLIMLPLGHKKDAETVRHRLVELFGKMPSDMKKSLTYDRGSELSKHKAITEESGVPIYFADPGSPWQRGTNENTNGLIRCYLPKESAFTQYTLQEIDEIQNRLNSRPRKCLGFQSPKNLLNELNYCPA